MTRRQRNALVRRYAGRQRVHLALLLTLSFVPAALAALSPLPLKLFIDNALGDEPLGGLPATLLSELGIGAERRTLVIVAAATTLLITISSSVLSSSVSLYWEYVGGGMVRDCARDVFDALQRLSPTFHAHRPRGDALSRVTTDTSAVYTTVNAALVSPTLHVATIAAIGWSAWRLDRQLTLLALTAAPFLAISSRTLGAHLKRHATTARRRQVSVVSLVSRIVDALPVVQAYTAESQNLDTFRRSTSRALSSSRRVALLQTSAEAVGGLIGAVGMAAVLLVGGRNAVRGDASVGELIVFLAYTRTLDAQCRGLLSVGRQLRLADVGLERVHEILSCQERVQDPASPRPLPPVQGGSSVTWDRVTFGYRHDQPVLEDITLRVEPGETVALVGRTGAGKSTLVALVSRLFDPTSGRMLIDGVDVRTASVSEVRSRVAVLRQEPLIITGSVSENITIGRPDSTAVEIEAAARLASAHEFICGLPAGYRTVLGAGGMSLSGGQRQRLAIARAFLKDAPILVLDEPASALDAETEAVLLASLQRLSAQRTVLIIAHRLATVRRADRVVVLEAGRVVEVGRPDELLARDGQYARFHDLQSLETSAR